MLIISFTEKGNALNKKIAKVIKDSTSFTTKETPGFHKVALSDYVQKGFEEKNPLVFIGAMGIAVRAIAPVVRDKFLDPPVIVIDEGERFVIPVLSGHVGGANSLAKELAQLLKAEVVLTTATDINGVFAVDIFAVENKLTIMERQRAKEISAWLLGGKEVSFCSEAGVEGALPEGIKKDFNNNFGIYVGVKNLKPFIQTLHLVPKCLCVGIGCRKGTSRETIEKSVSAVFDKFCLNKKGILCYASIDLKLEEQGLLAFCKQEEKALVFYSAEDLQKAKGHFTSSGFVKEITGIDNVCERSAMLVSENGDIIVPKQKNDGVTVAVAMKKWHIRF